MSKKLTAGKLIGIIFCISAAIAMCVLFGVNIYLGGQMKLIDKYLTALERDDFASYTACFSDNVAQKLDETDFTAAKSIAENLEDTEEFKAAASFNGREKLSSGRYSISFDLTVYNDEEHVKIENVSKVLIRSGGKWVIEAEV